MCVHFFNIDPALNDKYKKVVDDAMDDYYKRYILCRKNNSLFCTRYRSTQAKIDELRQNGILLYGCLAQDVLMSQADAGKTAGTILKTAYQYTAQEGISDIGVITYK